MGVALLERGDQLYDEGRYNEALALYQEQALASPTAELGREAHCKAGLCLVELNRLDEAQAAARRLMEAFPTYTLTLQREINPWLDKVFAERYVEALGVSGVPE